MICEKCWKDAGSRYDEYVLLLKSRKDCPCSPQEQAGEYWDERKKIDRRLKNG